jgi:hypothetical protein
MSSERSPEKTKLSHSSTVTPQPAAWLAASRRPPRTNDGRGPFSCQFFSDVSAVASFRCLSLVCASLPHLCFERGSAAPEECLSASSRIFSCLFEHAAPSGGGFRGRRFDNSSVCRRLWSARSPPLPRVDVRETARPAVARPAARASPFFSAAGGRNSLGGRVSSVLFRSSRRERGSRLQSQLPGPPSSFHAAGGRLSAPRGGSHDASVHT